jgi:hypothetical protein
MAQLAMSYPHIKWIVNCIDLWWFNQCSHIKVIETIKTVLYSSHYHLMVFLTNYKASSFIKHYYVPRLVIFLIFNKFFFNPRKYKILTILFIPLDKVSTCIVPFQTTSCDWPPIIFMFGVWNNDFTLVKNELYLVTYVETPKLKYQ